MANALLTLEIYRHAGTWCFTDNERDLLHEPFVLGIPEMINTIIKDKYSFVENSTYRVTFSSNPFPQTKFYLLQHESESGGCWYSLQKINELVTHTDKTLTGWLCPVTLKFFSAFPPEIYVDIHLSPETMSKDYWKYQ
jgi:hypothetical protein